MLILHSLGCWVKNYLWNDFYVRATVSYGFYCIHLPVNAVFNQEILVSAPICLKHLSTYFFCQQTIIDKKKIKKP